ncbi:MAG: copper resistance protein CopC [Actinobacteria bacterium]|nr:MAG: copper resistance protein CopC [Actinomycetota bacterium]
MKRSWLVIAVVMTALTAVPSAFAHAILQESSPSNNSVVRTSPKSVSLRFNEAVETAFGSIRVYDCGGGRVDSGKIVRPSKDSVAVQIDRKLPRGTYIVTWRVISADSHPVAGAFVFNVKKATPGGSCKQVFGTKTPGTIDALFKFVRALDFALILLVVSSRPRSASCSRVPWREASGSARRSAGTPCTPSSRRGSATRSSGRSGSRPWSAPWRCWRAGRGGSSSSRSRRCCCCRRSRLRDTRGRAAPGHSSST